MSTPPKSKLKYCGRCHKWRLIKLRSTGRWARAVCRKCENKRARTSPRYAVNSRRSHLRYRYGLSEAEYEKLYAAQQGLCAICQMHEPRLHVDHDHQTGAIRGLLCGPCNRGLSEFRDSPERLHAAGAYLLQQCPFPGRKRP